MNRRPKSFGLLGLLASLAVLTICVGPAQALTAGTFAWSIENEANLGIGGTEAISEGLKGTATLEGKLLGQKFKLTATTLTSSEALIRQDESAASGAGILKLSGLTVIEPAGCGVSSPIETVKLKTQMSEVGGVLYQRIEPVSETTLAKIKVSGCAIAGTYLLKGIEFGLVEPLGKEFVEQPVTFSPTILSTAGGELKLGTEPASFSVETSYTLGGGNAGKKVGVKKAAMSSIASETFALHDTKTVAIENTGDVTWQILGFGTPGSGFSETDPNQCKTMNKAVGPGHSCTVSIKCETANQAEKLVFTTTIGKLEPNMICD